MDSAQIDVGLILDKKDKAVHPSAAKLMTRHANQHPETSLNVSNLNQIKLNLTWYEFVCLQELVMAIKKRLPAKTMLPRQWEDFRNQFDENDPESKKSFNDFLTMLQKESFYRDTLAEALIYKQSAVRLTYQDEIKFMTAQQLKMQTEMGSFQQNIDDQAQNVSGPTFSWIINDMIMFHFQSTLMLLTTDD